MLGIGGISPSDHVGNVLAAEERVHPQTFGYLLIVVLQAVSDTNLHHYEAQTSLLAEKSASKWGTTYHILFW